MCHAVKSQGHFVSQPFCVCYMQFKCVPTAGACALEIPKNFHTGRVAVAVAGVFIVNAESADHTIIRAPHRLLVLRSRGET